MGELNGSLRIKSKKLGISAGSRVTYLLQSDCGLYLGSTSLVQDHSSRAGDGEGWGEWRVVELSLGTQSIVALFCWTFVLNSPISL